MRGVFVVPLLALLLGVLHMLAWRSLGVVSEKGPSFGMFSSTDTMKTRVITISDSATGKSFSIPSKLLKQSEVVRAFPSETSIRRLTASAACEFKIAGTLDGRFWKLSFVLPNRLESKVVLEAKGVRCSTNG